jgi:phosphomannomutase
MSSESRHLDELIADINPYFRSGEINTKVKDAREKIEHVAEAFKTGQQDRLDGLTVQFDDYWFNVRPSNTEPLLRLNVEANSKELLEKKTEEVLKIIRS